VTIRTRLSLWFTVAALLPAVILVIFSVSEAGRRFRSRAMEELRQVQESGNLELQQFRDEIAGALQRALESQKVGQIIDTVTGEGEQIPNIFLAAEEINADMALGFDFLDFLRADGTVLSSLEWKEFAGHTDIYWRQIDATPEGGMLVGPVRVEERDRLALRIIFRRRGVTIAGGKALDENLLGRFYTGARSLVFLVDRVGGQVLSEGGTDAERRMAGELARRIATEPGVLEGGQAAGRWSLSAGQYFVRSIPLQEGKGATAGAVLFLYPSEELDEAIAGLLTTFTLAAAVGVGLALLLGFSVARNVAKPLRQLINGFELVALGDFSFRLKRGRRSDEIAGLFEEFNGMAEDLGELRERLMRTERVAAWQEVARKVAHEIKNPLSPIQLSIETLRKVHERRHPDFESIFKESTQTILEEVEKIRRIVQEFSDFARMPEPEFGEVDLSSAFEKVLRLLAPRMGGIKVERRFEELPPVSADEDQIARMLTNLVLNAIEAMTGSGRLVLVLERARPRSGRGRWVRIAIADSGPGMSEEVRRSLFTPYFTTKTAGTGLGLVIAQRIAEQHHGRISVASEEGRGTVVEVLMPARRD
jgi:two-component system nitrogen regulation sensor histidine kinase NtrY